MNSTPADFYPYVGTGVPTQDDGASGYFDLPPESSCQSPRHAPPTYIFIPNGKAYRHVCPACGATVVLHHQPRPTLK